jgi:anti-sigma regulatory factor (Ser/Thr protein kinase)
MNTMAPIRPTTHLERRISLAAGPTAPGMARSRVRAAIKAWDVPVDPSIAVLLTSELVTNAVRHEKGDTITVVISSVCGQFCVDVHDTSPSEPIPVDEPVDAEAGRGLMLVASLSTSWGYYPTTAGKAVYFTLAFQGDLHKPGDPGPRGVADTSGES